MAGMMATCQAFIRISATDSAGRVHTVDVPFDSEHTVQQIFRAALGVAGVSTEEELERMRNGLPALDIHSDQGLWFDAWALLQAWRDLESRVETDPWEAAIACADADLVEMRDGDLVTVSGGELTASYPIRGLDGDKLLRSAARREVAVAALRARGITEAWVRTKPKIERWHGKGG